MLILLIYQSYNMNISKTFNVSNIYVHYDDKPLYPEFGVD